MADGNPKSISSPEPLPGTMPRPSSDSASNLPAPSPASSPEPKRTLTEILGESEQQTLTADTSEDESTPLETIEQLQKRLKLTPEQVYALKVPMSGGAEPLTLGEIKDRAAAQVDVELKEAQFDERRVQQEGELLRAQTELREVLSLLPKQAVTPEIIQRLRTNHEALLTREREATLDMIPQWRDAATYAADKAGMVRHLAEYGFTAAFLESIHDHRAIKYIRDNYLRYERMKAALAKVTTPTTVGQRPSAKPAKPAVKPDTATASTRRTGTPDQRSRIMTLLNK